MPRRPVDLVPLTLMPLTLMPPTLIDIAAYDRAMLEYGEGVGQAGKVAGSGHAASMSSSCAQSLMAALVSWALGVLSAGGGGPFIHEYPGI